jgi:hypothetical protein
MSSLLVFNRIYRLEIASHVGIFDPSCELLPLYLLSDLPDPSPPSQSKRSEYTDSVELWGGDDI